MRGGGRFAKIESEREGSRNTPRLNRQSHRNPSQLVLSTERSKGETQRRRARTGAPPRSAISVDRIYRGEVTNAAGARCRGVKLAGRFLGPVWCLGEELHLCTFRCSHDRLLRELASVSQASATVAR